MPIAIDEFHANGHVFAQAELADGERLLSSAACAGVRTGCADAHILALKSLHRSEREARKRLFDHYVFNEGDPAAHIPMERRNRLGRLTPSLVEQIKQKIRSCFLAWASHVKPKSRHGQCATALGACDESVNISRHSPCI